MIIYTVRDSKQAEEVRFRHSVDERDLRFVEVGPGFVSRLRSVIDSARNDEFICLVHGDVTLPSAFRHHVAELRDELDRSWPNWGAVGNAGVTPLGFGLRSRRRIRYFFDNEFGPNLSGHIVPAENLLENVVLISAQVAGEVFDGLPDTEDRDFFALALSLEVLRSGRALLLAPHLACYRDDRIPPESGNLLQHGNDADSWMAQRVANVSIDTYRGRVDLNGISDSFRHCERIDLALQSLRNAQVGRDVETVTIVTRTRFERPAFLDRAVLTTRMFIAAAEHAIFEHCVISGPAFTPRSSLPDSVRYLSGSTNREVDDRFLLVREAASKLESRYLWFIDDDDWLFPNAAEQISLMVSLAPPGSSLFMDVMHFAESNFETTMDGPPSSLVRPIRRFPASQFASGLTGQNFTPFSGMILDRESVLGIPAEVFDRITYFEDYTLILTSILGRERLSVSLGVLASGVSMRSGDHSATQPDRRPWNASLAELSHYMARSPSFAPLLSVGDLMIPTSMDPDARRGSFTRHRASDSLMTTWLRRLKRRTERTVMWRFLRRFRLLRKAFGLVRRRIDGTE